MSDADKTVGGKRSTQPGVEEPPSPASQGPRYTAGPEIARGGMGRVIEATDALLGRTVAVKQVLSRDPELLKRFARETRITARLEHPSIVPVYDAGTTADGAPFYVMRMVTGRPLEQLVGDATTLARRLALVPHVLAAAQAVAHAHERGVVHRDLKPSNILVGAHGETVVIDWGLAKVIDDADDDGPGASPLAGAGDSLATRVGLVFGTPGFMSPEQLAGDPVDERGDVYALGATLYHLLSQHAPHEASSGTEMMQQASARPPRPLDDLVEGVPPELSTIVDKALARDPAQRYPNAGALAEELSRFLAGQLVAAHRYSRRERLRRFVRKHRVSVAVTLLALLGVSVFGAIAIARVLEERDRADASAMLATKRQIDAEAARAREMERADQILLLQARTLVEPNPTATIATLKQLRAPPERWDRLWRNARGIAADARAHGVARAMPGPEYPMNVRFSDDGNSIVMRDRDQQIWDCDLVRGTSRVITRFSDDFDQLELLDDARLLAWSVGSAVPAALILDRATGRELARVALGRAATSLVPTMHGVLWSDAEGGLWRIGEPTYTVEQLATTGPIGQLSLSHGRDRVVMFRQDQVFELDLQTFALRELARGHGTVERVAWSGDDARLAVVTDQAYANIDLATAATTWYASRLRPMMAGITRRTLASISIGSSLEVVAGGQLEPRYMEKLDIGAGLHATRNGQLVALSGRKLLVIDGYVVSTITVPSEGLQRLGAHPRSRFVTGLGRGRVFVWDLDSIEAPALTLPDVGGFVLSDRNNAMMMHDSRWFWLDPATGQRRAIPDVSPLLMVAATSNPELMVGIDLGAGRRAIAVHRDGRIEEIADGVTIVQHREARAFYVVRVNGALDLVDLATDQTTPLRATPAANVGSLSWSPAAVALRFEDGAVWRRDAAGREMTRAFAPNGSALVILHVDQDGSVVVPDGDRLMRWMPDDSVVEVAKLPDQITGLVSNAGFFIVSTRDRAAWLLEKSGTLGGRIPTGAGELHVSRSTSLAVFVDAMRNIEVTDLTTTERWSMLFGGRWSRVVNPQISSDGELVGAITERGLQFWPTRLPATAAATAAWLDELTNATAETGDTALAWPTPGP